MPGDEQKIMNRAENHARSAIISSTKCTSNKNFILKYFRCRDGKRAETRIGMEGICIPAFHHCEPLCVACTLYTVYSASGMQEWVIQIPSIPIPPL